MKKQSFRNILKTVVQIENKLFLKYGKISDRDDINYQIINYCNRRLNVPKEIYQNSIEICGSIARSILEIEVITKWLVQDETRYQAFLYSALETDSKIMEPMKKLREIESKNEYERKKITRQFDAAISYSKRDLPRDKHPEVKYFRDIKKWHHQLNAVTALWRTTTCVVKLHTPRLGY